MKDPKDMTEEELAVAFMQAKNAQSAARREAEAASERWMKADDAVDSIFTEMRRRRSTPPGGAK